MVEVKILKYILIIWFFEIFLRNERLVREKKSILRNMGRGWFLLVIDVLFFIFILILEFLFLR